MGDWYATQTIGLLPERAARQWGPREALAFQGRRWTFSEMHARVDAVARGLLSLGIPPEDMAYILGQSDPAAVLLADRSGPVDYLAMIREVVPGLGSRPDPRFPCLRHVVVLSDRAEGGGTDWRGMLDRGGSGGAAALHAG